MNDKEKKSTDELTVGELEEMLTTRRTTLKELQARRFKVQSELDQIDAEIEVLTGAKGTRRRRNKVSLRRCVVELLQKNKNGYTLTELSREILNSGYTTTSSNFRNVLYQCLYNTPGIFHDYATGTYRYKEQEPTPKGRPASHWSPTE